MLDLIQVEFNHDFLYCLDVHFWKQHPVFTNVSIFYVIFLGRNCRIGPRNFHRTDDIPQGTINQFAVVPGSKPAISDTPGVQRRGRI